jgi:hypothetical protein
MKSSPYTWPFGQPWLSQTEPAFAPGQVFIACENDALVIRAELNDAHVTQDVFPFNFPAFMHCDAFEIFLGPADEKAYYELQVTPSNSVLQLRFYGVEEAKQFEALTVAEPHFYSETSLTPDGWSVIVRIPLDGLFPTTHPEWLLSFGRYDYTPGQPKPVISSTSPHAICNFHRREEWRRVWLADLSENFGAVPHFMGVK